MRVGPARIAVADDRDVRRTGGTSGSLMARRTRWTAAQSGADPSAS